MGVTRYPRTQKNTSNKKFFIAIDLIVFNITLISGDVIASALIRLLLRICKSCLGLCEARPGQGRAGPHDPYRRDVFAQPEIKTKTLNIQTKLTWRCLLRLELRADLFLSASEKPRTITFSCKEAIKRSNIQ
jgi:hypothetical protein